MTMPLGETASTAAWMVFLALVGVPPPKLSSPLTVSAVADGRARRLWLEVIRLPVEADEVDLDVIGRVERADLEPEARHGGARARGLDIGQVIERRPAGAGRDRAAGANPCIARPEPAGVDIPLGPCGRRDADGWAGIVPVRLEHKSREERVAAFKEHRQLVGGRADGRAGIAFRVVAQLGDARERRRRWNGMPVRKLCRVRSVSCDLERTVAGGRPRRRR